MGTTASDRGSRVERELREFIDLMLTWYEEDTSRLGPHGGVMYHRRQGGITALREVQRILDGDERGLEALRKRSVQEASNG